MNENMKLWDAVEKTNPKYTKSANVRGNKITAIGPQSQIKCATEQFGTYGATWGWKSFDFHYELLDTTGIVIFKGVFFFPSGEFPISSSISAYKDGARTKPDADFAKKVETDALTKALSKLGFNADIFMGLYDDNKYVMEMEKEFREPNPALDAVVNAINNNDSEYLSNNWDAVTTVWGNLDAQQQQFINNLNQG